MVKKDKPRKKQGSTGISVAARLYLLMGFISFLMISAFTMIQVKNQLSTTTGHNAYRSRLSATLVKSYLEKALAFNDNPQVAIGELEETLFSLKSEQIIHDAWIINPEQEKVANTDIQNPDKAFTLSEKYMIESILRKEYIDQWFYTFLDKERGRRLDIYIPLLRDNKLTFLAKTSFSLGNVKEALKEVYVPIGFMAFAVLLLNALLGLALSRSIVNPLRVLNQATKKIAGGKLDERVNIHTGDEIEELGNTFNEMTEALKKMKQRAESANPLTGLPGNVSIREDLEERIRQGRKFVFVHSDLDNFKAYNDKYGLSNGDRAIIKTADLLKESIQAVGDPEDDFLGHEGGDDFVIITTPERAERVASHFIKNFTAAMPELYNEDDRKRGYIIAKNRQGVICKFAIMAISLAACTNEFKPIESYTEMTNLMPEMKEKAKSIEGSCYVIDQRKSDTDRQEEPPL